MNDRVSRLLRFAAVGLTNTVIDFATFNLLLRGGAPRVAANVAAVALALTFSYFANSRWAFRDGDGSRRQLLLFLAVTGVGMALNTLIVGLLGDPGTWPWVPAAAVVVPNTAKVVASGISMAWNYLGYARFVFRGNPAAAAEATADTAG